MLKWLCRYLFPDIERINERKPIPVELIKRVQRKCKNQDDDLRWLVAILSDSRMRLGEAVGLLKSDIKLDANIPHISLKPHQWRTLKTKGSEPQYSSCWGVFVGFQAYSGEQ